MKMMAFLIALLPNSAKKIVLRVLFHADIAHDVHIGFGTVIRAKKIRLERGVRIGMFTYIRVHELTMRTRARIGSRSFVSLHRLRMGPRSIVGGQVAVEGDHTENGVLEMGMYAWIFQHCFINVMRPITLGVNVGVGGGTYIFTHGSWLSKLDGFPVTFAKVSIDDNTWIPWGCFIMPGVSIGKNVVVAARSVVTKSVPDNALVAGAPAKIIREQSNKVMTKDDKKAVFEELASDYAAHIGCALTLDRLDGGTLYNFSNHLVIHLCADELALRDDMFNVCWATISDERFYSYKVLSLADYKSSPQDAFPSAVIDFLVFCSRIGLRYYPVDEICMDKCVPKDIKL